MSFLGELGPLHWLGIAALLLVFELITGTTYILWLAAAAAVLTLINFIGLDFSWEADLVMFGLFSTAFLVFGHYYVKPRMKGEAAVGLNEPAHALIGRRARAVADFHTGEGRVKLGDSEWRARTDDQIEAEEELVVVGVEGTTLRVEAWDG